MLPADNHPLGNAYAAFAGARMLLRAPRRTTDVSNWQGHIPFAMVCVELARPRLLVELGTHRGDSYCSFCQAVQELHLPTECIAVDTWQGDPQTGFYESDVLSDLRSHHDPLYSDFSKLLQSTFADALHCFDDGSVDLLHIDGCHTYDAVRSDFENWLPKLSPRAVVLLHDTAHREPTFGVWRLWLELRARYPSIEFPHSSGLGVVVVGEEPPRALRDLIESSAAERNRVVRLFATLGSAVRLRTELRLVRSALERQLADADAERRLLLESHADKRADALAHIASLHAQIADLKRLLLTEVERREVTVRLMEQSTSWKMTAPLRASKTALRRALR